MPKKTYILIFKKKFENEPRLQTNAIFTYLVSEIGETRDAKRFETEKNNLSKMERLFNQFKGYPNKEFSFEDKRCKIYTVQEILEKLNLLCDRWWSDEEKKELRIKDDNNEMNEEEFLTFVDKIFEDINSFKEYANV